MFWKKKAKTKAVGTRASRPESDADTEGEEAATGPPLEAEQAVDFIAELLRIQGQHAFDLDDVDAETTAELHDRWARHLLVGIPPPGREPVETDGEDVARPNVKRDIPGLRNYFSDHRGHESRYVVASMDDLREAIWTFIHGLRRGMTEDQAADRQVAHRMRRLEQAVRGNDTERIKSEATETIGLMSRLISERGDRYEEQIESLADRLERMRGELDAVRKKAATDGLTRLYNRDAFDEQIERELDFATLFGHSICLLMIDVDDFKWVNDTHGHRVGDEVLRLIAGCLGVSFVRKDDYCARYGGEEFVVILREVDATTAIGLTDRLMHAVRHLEIDFEKVESLRVSISVGVAQLRRGETSAQWVERADKALYRAKQAGKDRVEADPGDLE